MWALNLQRDFAAGPHYDTQLIRRERFYYNPHTNAHRTCWMPRTMSTKYETHVRQHRLVDARFFYTLCDITPPNPPTTPTNDSAAATNVRIGGIFNLKRTPLGACGSQIYVCALLAMHTYMCSRRVCASVSFCVCVCFLFAECAWNETGARAVRKWIWM